MGRAPMTTDQVVVAYLIFAIIVGIFLVDLGLLLWRGEQSTFSLTLRAAAECWPPLPWFFAVLFGALLSHWFW